MRTVLTSKIDGFDIIGGFGDAVIDREATIEKLAPDFAASQEMTDIVAKKIEIKDIMDLAKVSLNLAKKANTKATAELEHAKYRNYLANAEVKQQVELMPLHDAMKSKSEELWASNQVIHFEPKLGEFLDSGLTVKCATLAANYPLPTNKLLSLDGTLVDDLRGVRYWEKDVEWVGTDILQIGVVIPVGAIRGEDLTPAQIEEIELQFETARVALLTTEEKLAEKTKALELAAIEAERLFNQYTIQATADPLAESQAWLATETARIEAKYA